MIPPSDNDLEALAPGVREVLISAEDIQARVRDLGAAISADYAHRIEQGDSLVMVGVLKGVVLFMADLIRYVRVPLEIDFMAVANYSPESRDQGLVRLVKDLESSIRGRHVLFVEDVIDTGLTLNYLLNALQTRGPASLEVCVLFNKPKHRLIDIPLKYKGFDLPDLFVVGYGLDHREIYRNLPYVGLLTPEVFMGHEP